MKSYLIIAAMIVGISIHAMDQTTDKQAMEQLIAHLEKDTNSAVIITKSYIRRCQQNIHPRDDGSYYPNQVRDAVKTVLAGSLEEEKRHFIQTIFSSDIKVTALMTACAAFFTNGSEDINLLIDKIGLFFDLDKSKKSHMAVYLRKYHELRSRVKKHDARWNGFYDDREHTIDEFFCAAKPIKERGQERIYLVNSGISSLYGCDKWPHVENVESLDLSRNCILDGLLDPECPIHPFQQFKNLIYLNLSKNHLKYIKVGFLKGVTHLQELHLEENDIQEIEGNPFGDCPHLTGLGINRTKFLENLIPKLLANSTIWWH